MREEKKELRGKKSSKERHVYTRPSHNVFVIFKDKFNKFIDEH